MVYTLVYTDLYHVVLCGMSIHIPSRSNVAIPIPIPVPKLHCVYSNFPQNSHSKNGNPKSPFPKQTSSQSGIMVTA